MIKKLFTLLRKLNKSVSFLMVSVVVILLGVTSFRAFEHINVQRHSVLGMGNTAFIASIDTMKESRDTQTHPLTDAKITQDVSLSASIHTTHITVDTNWDYVDYFRTWAKAVHLAGKHIWVRGHPNQWENNNGASGIMTPTAYKQYERTFILQNADIFETGDIFDPASEPELGHYWHAQYPTWNNATTIEYNQFLRDTTDVANGAFAEKGVVGVITTIHSTNAWMAIHRLEPATLEKMGVVTIDSYPDQNDTDASTAVNDRIRDITSVYNAVHVPIILGELGYSNKIQVDDQTQHAVLQAELNAIQKLNYIVGINYWVGAGGPGHGGYTNIFSHIDGTWVSRPAATDLSNFFLAKQIADVSITPVISNIPKIISPTLPPTTNCSLVPDVSVKHFCDRSNPNKPLTKATITWDILPQNANVTYKIVYGRQGKDPASVSTTTSTITVPQSTTYGLYSDGSTYTTHVEYSSASCKNQKTPNIEFIPLDCK